MVLGNGLVKVFRGMIMNSATQPESLILHRKLREVEENYGFKNNKQY